MVELQRKFRAFTAKMVQVARSNFKGRITYGMGWDIVDYSGDVPVIPPQYVRNEQEQADHLTNMPGVFTDEGFLGASPYTFISPDAPHRPHDRRHDEDMAAFSLCKVLRMRDGDPASPYHWLPKKSFHAVSAFYRRQGS